jgi:hypothetical protein
LNLANNLPVALQVQKDLPRRGVPLVQIGQHGLKLTGSDVVVTLHRSRDTTGENCA